LVIEPAGIATQHDLPLGGLQAIEKNFVIGNGHFAAVSLALASVPSLGKVGRITVEERVLAVVLPNQIDCRQRLDCHGPKACRYILKPVNGAEKLRDGFRHLPPSSQAKNPTSWSQRRHPDSTKRLSASNEEGPGSADLISGFRRTHHLAKDLSAIWSQLALSNQFEEVLLGSKNFEELNKSLVKVIEDLNFAFGLSKKNVGSTSKRLDVDAVLWEKRNDLTRVVKLSTVPSEWSVGSIFRKLGRRRFFEKANRATWFLSRPLPREAP
jgi:hypothetical protein